MSSSEKDASPPIIGGIHQPSPSPMTTNDTCLSGYLESKNIDALRECILDRIRDNTVHSLDLVSIARTNGETAALIKELIGLGRLDDSTLVEQVAKRIVHDIERHVDDHLRRYQKFTLNVQCTDLGGSTSQFFELISLLRDVSLLGQRLLDLAPQFNARKRSPSKSSSPNLSANRHSPPPPQQAGCKSSPAPASASASASQVSASMLAPTAAADRAAKVRDDDATSEDLLAALIESSSSDDFLVLSSSLDSISVGDMIIAAMLYIKSHECFTLSHDIQSVVLVLRRMKFMIINILAPKGQMELIARMLTSVGRYNEMTYVFDLFRDKNQFEVLLSKGVEKTPELRIALFNYVKKNPEFYSLVTLNFSMFREIAESLEASASKRLDKIIAARRRHAPVATTKETTTTTTTATATTSTTTTTTTTAATVEAAAAAAAATAAAARRPSSALEVRPRSFSVSGRTKEALSLSLIEMMDASDCYSKAGCYKRSNDCEKRAKLIALEIALMSSGEAYTNLLDLSHSAAELTEAICGFSSFAEAHIVADVYDFHLAWRQALFKNVILDENIDYLNDYCKRYELSSALAEELVTLFRQFVLDGGGGGGGGIEQDKRARLAESMRALLAKLADVELKCKLYTQLSFDDAKKELLKDAAIQAHLRDLRLA